MNNAGINTVGTSWDGLENWKKVFDVNLFGFVFTKYVCGMLYADRINCVCSCQCRECATDFRTGGFEKETRLFAPTQLLLSAVDASPRKSGHDHQHGIQKRDHKLSVRLPLCMHRA